MQLASAPYIAVTGNIGSGKTSLTQLLSEDLGWKAAYEQAEENPYLKSFYEDMPRWAFHVQIFFLNSRFEQVKRTVSQAAPVVQDRTIYEDAHIFAKNLHNSGLMVDQDFASYQRLYNNMIEYVAPPKLMVYLRADLEHLLKRIRLRGRDYEANFPVDYLRSLNELYEDWIAGYRTSQLLVIESAEYDYVNKPADRATVLSQVKEALAEL